MTGPTRADPAGRAYRDLQNLARREGRTTQELLTMYVVERWLARLAASSHASDFVLKGGVLLAAHGQRRPTVDADTWARNLARDQESVGRRIAEIAALASQEDGVTFRPATLTTQVIRDEALYSGVRVSMDATLATATVRFRLDVSFGDPITPAPEMVELPSLRPGGDTVRVLGYPLATVVAEKLVTAVDLGPANTRVRDFADIYTISTSTDVDRDTVHTAITATARFRGVPLRPLSEAVGDLVPLRARTYDAYRRGLGAAGTSLPPTFAGLVAAVSAYADPLLHSLDR